MLPVPTIVVALLCAMPLWAKSTEPVAPLHAIAQLDIQRYMGTWYEIAKYPNAFQRKCAAETRADYTLLDGGRVQVVNRCRNAAGGMEEVIGAARQTGPSNSAKLEVRFAPAWLAFLPFVWGNYWVIDLDPAYQLVAVSEPSREYLWILSRSPHVEPAAYSALLQRLAIMGFDLRRLETSNQPG
ncbi:MAG: lipocalin family protein [Burkholderiales bacterium]|nr:lipocalin family protein [Burkholderiales bacterium]